MKRSIYTFIIYHSLLAILLLHSCTIKDDLPLPLVKSEITDILIEGQCSPNGQGEPVALIDKEKRTVDIYVDDRVDVSKLYIRSMDVSNDATVRVKGTDISFKPSQGLMPTLDFSQEVVFELVTYQKYEWKIRVHQVVVREVEVENQVGTAVIDTVNNNVVVYVSPSQNLSAVKVNKMVLGGIHGTVTPDPTGQTLDFSMRRTFSVRCAWKTELETWNVYVYNADSHLSTTASVFAHSVRAFVSGEKQNGTTPKVQYRQTGEAEWCVLPAEKVVTSQTEYSAEVDGLLPGTEYELQVVSGETATAVKCFTTAPAIQIENGSFDFWSQEGAGNQILYRPWADGQTAYWDTGNRGATTVGASNTTGVTEDGRTFANLQSKYIVIKFAAGSIFTGKYLKTDGTNGILGFGRPFNSFPTHLQFDFRYYSSIINKGGTKWEESYARYISREVYEGLRGKPDMCQVYVALIGDADEEEFEGTVYPYVIRTRPSELKLFDPQSDNVIAYGQLTQDCDVTQWTTHTIQIEYRHRNRTPKYIIIVASSSKYGDYFLGGDKSLLQLDNMKLLYE
ncbi:MAG: PCMD domain-containing protein [Bacteroidaceae bacterium]|nr:PCMD domain-containing protein [Bacteroidaceae bacterium]